MKRFTTLAPLFLAAALVLVPAYVFSDGDETAPAPQVRYANFIDEDGDGICDNWQAGGQGLGLGKGTRENFVDEDGDGVCDNYQSGLRKGKGQGRGYKQGAGFLDANDDGVCDNCTGDSKKVRSRIGNGRGRSGK